MLKRTKHGQNGCVGEFSLRDEFNLQNKKAERFRSYSSYISSYTINSTTKKNERGITFFEENVAAFCFKNTST